MGRSLRKKVLRSRAGQEGTDGLTDLQKKIYEFIVSRNGATPAEMVKELKGLDPMSCKTRLLS